MDNNLVLEHLPSIPIDAESQVEFLLNRVQGEFEDEDGDWATGFITADPIPEGCFVLCGHGNGGSYPLCGRKRHHDHEALFACGSCSIQVPLQMLGPELECGCLCCVTCLRRVVELHLLQDSEGRLDGFSPQSISYLCCPSCSHQVSMSSRTMQSLAPDIWRNLEEKASDIFFKNADYLRCPGCNIMIEKVSGEMPSGVVPSGVPELDRTVPFIELDDDGRPLSRRALFDKYSNFFRCALCKVDFCGFCMKVPYHLGHTCQEFDELQSAVCCLYCMSRVQGDKCSANSSTDSLTVKDLRRNLDKQDVDTSWCVEKADLVKVYRRVSSICSAKECRQRLRKACTRNLECGHLCGGLRGERACLPCLEDGCIGKRLLGKNCALPSANDWCTICMVESLQSAPSIQLKCGHIVHFDCAKQKLRKGFPGPEISFGFMNCPQCSQRMEHESLAPDILKTLDLFNVVRERALKRLSMEKLKPAVVPKDLESYALQRYLYYICYKCNEPYFGGNRECGANQGQDNAGAGMYNPQELICGGCSAVMGNDRCKKGHGTRYLEFKCKYCCAVAAYFCFGHTHFCTRCHVTRPDGRPDFVPRHCQGPQSCPLRVPHAPNGEEYCLGCSMCRILSQ